MSADREAYEYYRNPANLVPAGSGRKRKHPALTSMAAVRFDPAIITAVKRIAAAEGVTVSTWIRRAVTREEERHRRAWLDANRHGLEVVPGSGRAVAPRALPSSLAQPAAGRTFACEHMSVGNVVSVSCGTCGPLRPAA